MIASASQSTLFFTGAVVQAKDFVFSSFWVDSLRHSTSSPESRVLTTLKKYVMTLVCKKIQKNHINCSIKTFKERIQISVFITYVLNWPSES